MALYSASPAAAQKIDADGDKTISWAEAKAKSEVYNALLPYKRPSWTIAAFVRQGRIYEILTRAILNAPFVVPADLAKQLKALPEENREEVRIAVEDRIRQLLDQ